MTPKEIEKTIEDKFEWDADEQCLFIKTNEGDFPYTVVEQSIIFNFLKEIILQVLESLPTGNFDSTPHKEKMIKQFKEYKV